MSKAYILPGLGTGSIKSLQVYRAGAPHRAPVRFSGHRVVNSHCVEVVSPGTFAALKNRTIVRAQALALSTM